MSDQAQNNKTVKRAKGVNFKPADHNDVSPYIMTEKPRELITFLEKVFEAKQIFIMEDDTKKVSHAEVKIGDSVVMLAEGAQGEKTTSHIHVYVEDVDAVFERAKESGAKIIQPPAVRGDPNYRGGFDDGMGTVWWVGMQVEEN